jgi:hypothetical protein
LAILEERITKMEADHKAGAVLLCSGSNKLFRAQFELTESGYAGHAALLMDWRAARTSELTVIGLKDETGGCQGTTS